MTDLIGKTSPVRPLKEAHIAFVYKKKRTVSDLVNHFIDLYVARRIARRSREFNISHGGKMAIFANDFIGIHINQYGFFERPALEMVFAFLDPVLGDLEQGVALDIGANIGNHSIFFSRHFSCVHSFEPHPRIFDLLSFNAKLAGNVVPYNFGLGEKEESLELYENWENMGSSSIKHRYSAQAGKVTIGIKRLDDIELNAGPITFMKIDVEGFESSVIRGAWGTIRKHQPLILMEQLESEFVAGSTKSLEVLKEEGYVFCWNQPWATSRGWLERRMNTVRNLLMGGTYDYDFIAGTLPPPATYEMLIAVPRRFQSQLLSHREVAQRLPRTDRGRVSQ